MTKYLVLGERSISVDPEGFLNHLSDWDAEVAGAIAASESVNLTASHWEILNLIRTYYQTHGVTLANRALVSLVKRELGAEKGKSIYLMKLFTGSPAKISNKIAGLPKPDNCL